MGNTNEKSINNSKEQIDLVFQRLQEQAIQPSTSGDEQQHSFTCAYCRKKSWPGFIYKCLECGDSDYHLCELCFEKRKCNGAHQLGHKLLRFDAAPPLDLA